MFAHAAIANVISTPEIEITENESTLLARPLSTLAAMYGVEIDPKIAAWMELAGAASYVYGPRAVMIRMRLKQEAAEKRAAQEAPDEIIPGQPSGETGQVVKDNFIDMTGLQRGPLSTKIN